MKYHLNEKRDKEANNETKITSGTDSIQSTYIACR